MAVTYKTGKKHAEKIIGWMKAAGLVKRADVAGSIRRKVEETDDIDIVVTPKNVDDFKAWVEHHFDATGGKQKLTGWYKGMKVEWFIATNKSFGAALMYATGPAGRNIYNRTVAKKKGFKLTRHGLFDRKTEEYVTGRTEKAIYKKLGLEWRDPEDR